MALASLWQHPPYTLLLLPPPSSLSSPSPPPAPPPPIFSFLLCHIVPPPIRLTLELQFLTSVLLVTTFCPSSLLSPQSLTSINHLSFS